MTHAHITAEKLDESNKSIKYHAKLVRQFDTKTATSHYERVKDAVKEFNDTMPDLSTPKIILYILKDNEFKRHAEKNIVFYL